MRLLASLHYKSVKLPKWNQSQNTMKSLVDFNVNREIQLGLQAMLFRKLSNQNSSQVKTKQVNKLIVKPPRLWADG